MKLLCLYVDSYRSLNSQMLNFDSEDRFTFDLKSKKLSYKHFGGLPGDFFSTSKRKKHGHVESVSAIIGKNGSGKTSIATLMNRCMSPGKDSEIKFVFVLKNGCRYSCYHNFDDGVNDDDVKCKITDWQVINFGQMDSLASHSLTAFANGIKV